MGLDVKDVGKPSTQPCMQGPALDSGNISGVTSSRAGQRSSMVMPGRTSSMAPSFGRASPGPQVMAKSERPVPAVRRSAHVHNYPDDKLLPGLIHRDDGISRGQGHSQYMMTTDRITQHGLEENQRMISSIPATPYWSSSGQAARPVSTVRPQSALAMTSPTVSSTERPPSSLGVAWGSSHKYGTSRQGAEGTVTPLDPQGQDSLESRLKSLMIDPRTADRLRARGPGGQQHRDGEEIIFPVHQRSRSHGDGVTQGSSGVQHVRDGPEDVYAVVAGKPEQSRGSVFPSGYVPSLPGDRRVGPQVDNHAHPHPYGQPLGVSRGLRGQENPAYVPEVLHHRRQESGVKGPASTSHDLRSAWQRLYGSRQEPPSGQRHSVEELTNTKKTPQQNTHPQSPHLARPLNSRPPSSIGDIPETAAAPRLKPSSASHTFPSHHPYNSSNEPSYTTALPHSLASGRESPTGQSSSNPEPVSGSNNSSQLSAYSAVTQGNLSTFKPEMSSSGSSPDPTIGPASKYPDVQTSSRGSRHPTHLANHKRNVDFNIDHKRQAASPLYFKESQPSIRLRTSSTTSEVVDFNVGDSAPLRPLSRGPTLVASGDEVDEEDYPILTPADSIFNYPGADSENESVSPPLPPLSPMATPHSSANATPTNMSPRYTHTNDRYQSSSPKTPDLLRKSYGHASSRSYSSKQDTSKPTQHHATRTQVSRAENEDRRYNKQGGHTHNEGQGHRHSSDNIHVRSRSLEDVRESENESMLSFDVENTLLTVEPSDQSEMGTLRSQKSGSVRAQLHRLEGMYSHVMKTLEENSHGPRARRRWSIGSSDTSSFHQHSHRGKHGHTSRGSSHKLSSRDVRSIGKRFQRLESHVITLARSVAHLSSELRSHNAVSREIENVKLEMQELKAQGSAHASFPRLATGSNIMMSDFERGRGWVPSLTNPKRVNKLTKFFGVEPPLLMIFLKRLGYERYLKNFEDEHIGMIELPYMSEERLQSIGIPMGPRLRILQEAQVCFKQGNFDIYFV